VCVRAHLKGVHEVKPGRNCAEATLLISHRRKKSSYKPTTHSVKGQSLTQLIATLPTPKTTPPDQQSNRSECCCAWGRVSGGSCRIKQAVPVQLSRYLLLAISRHCAAMAAAAARAATAQPAAAAATRVSAVEACWWVCFAWRLLFFSPVHYAH